MQFLKRMVKLIQLGKSDVDELYKALIHAGLIVTIEGREFRVVSRGMVEPLVRSQGLVDFNQNRVESYRFEPVVSERVAEVAELEARDAELEAAEAAAELKAELGPSADVRPPASDASDASDEVAKALEAVRAART
jgi:hypothetical protein